jgi:hypothetical protein
MTDYTTITDTQVDPEAPITSELMTALRDNPIAISEGSSGAPKIQNAAIQDSAVTTSKIANGNVTAPKIPISTVTNSGTLIDAGAVTIAYPPSNYIFFPSLTGTNSVLRGQLTNNGLYIQNVGNNTGTYTVTWRYIS